MLKVPFLSNEAFLSKYGFSYFKPHTILSWHGYDTEQRYRKHMSKLTTRKKLEEEHFTDTNIEYRFNNYGFRTDVDFDIMNPERGSIFIGCSVTEAVALNIEDCWAYKVAKKRGEAHYNLGQGGTGLETQYRLLRAWAPFLKPTAVFTLGSYEPRREMFAHLIRNHQMAEIPELFYSAADNSNSLIYKKYLSCPMEAEISSLRTFDAIKQICVSVGAELYVPDQDFHTELVFATNGNLARDLSHPGRLYHAGLAENLDKWIRIV
jgi:hypothetical protein